MWIVSPIGTFVEELDELVESVGGGGELRYRFAVEGRQAGEGVGFCEVGEEHGEVVGVGLFGILFRKKKVGASQQMGCVEQEGGEGTEEI